MESQDFTQNVHLRLIMLKIYLYLEQAFLDSFENLIWFSGHFFAIFNKFLINFWQFVEPSNF